MSWSHRPRASDRARKRTLKQGWPRADTCVQHIDVQCVLQFKLIHAGESYPRSSSAITADWDRYPAASPYLEEKNDPERDLDGHSSSQARPRPRRAKRDDRVPRGSTFFASAEMAFAVQARDGNFAGQPRLYSCIHESRRPYLWAFISR